MSDHVLNVWQSPWGVAVGYFGPLTYFFGSQHMHFSGPVLAIAILVWGQRRSQGQ